MRSDVSSLDHEFTIMRLYKRAIIQLIHSLVVFLAIGAYFRMQVLVLILSLLDAPGAHWRQLVVLLVEPAVLLEAGVHEDAGVLLVLASDFDSGGAVSVTATIPHAAIQHIPCIKILRPINVTIWLYHIISGAALPRINVSRLLSIIQLLRVISLHEYFLVIASHLTRALEVGVEAVALGGENARDALSLGGVVRRLEGACLVHLIHPCNGISQEFLIDLLGSVDGTELI